MTQTRTEQLLERLVTQVALISEAKTVKAREEGIVRLTQTLFLIMRPRFDKKRLLEALRKSCTDKPDFGDPVVGEGRKVHLNGTFDLDALSHAYFVEAPITING